MYNLKEEKPVKQEKRLVNGEKVAKNREDLRKSEGKTAGNVAKTVKNKYSKNKI